MKEIDKDLPFDAAIAINNAGQVVARSGSNWYLWHHGRRKLLEPLPGDFLAPASAMNDRGQVVGLSLGCDEVSCTQDPVLWDGDDVIGPSGLEGAFFHQVHGINNRGDIVGLSGFLEEQFFVRGFLAEPH